MRKSGMREFFDAKTDIRKLPVIARPTFRLGENNCAQNLAAFQLRGLLLLLYRLGMERTLGLRRIGPSRHRSKRAMIRDREPGTDYNQGDCPARAHFHRELQIVHTRRISNFFFGIKDRRDRSGRYAFWWHNVWNGTSRDW